MANNEIVICLEQKVILLTKVLDLTKQIQVRSRQPDIELDDFLDQRASYMKRVHKCNELISSITEQFPLEQQERIERVLNSEVSEKECLEDELLILTLTKKSILLLQRTASIDKSAYEAIREQYNTVRDKLNQLRKEGKTPFMFSNFH